MPTQSTPGKSRLATQIESRQRLRAFANQLPQRPGVYIMLDTAGTVIYVGKAVNLRRRVGSYAAPSAGRDRKISRLVGSIASLSYVQTHSELEALLLESRLIKMKLPQFNRQLIDPESCCFLRADFGERLPRIEVVRFRRDDGAEYLGPFWHSPFVRDAADAVTGVFRIRRCAGDPGRKEAPCMYCELGKCSGPCSGRVSVDEYRQLVSAAWESMAGLSSEAAERLAMRRDRLSDELRFEEAYAVHQQIRALRQVASSVPDASLVEGTFAVVTPSCLRGRPVVLVFKGGSLLSSALAGPRAYPDRDMIADLLTRVYATAEDMLPGRPSRDDMLIIQSHLNRRPSSGVIVPLISHKPVRTMADSILSAIDTLRRG